MPLPNWFASLVSKFSGPQQRRPAASARRSRRITLRLEALEDRWAPAALLVTRADDPATSTVGTLRWALAEANAAAANGVSDAIYFNSSLNGATIPLNSGPLTLTGHTGAATIAIVGGGQITLDGLGLDRVFVVQGGARADLGGLTIRNGRQGTSNTTLEEGGGIENSGTLTIHECTIRDNSVVLWGGGICNRGTMTITACTIADNSAYDGSGGTVGGGLINFGTLTVTNSTITRNSARNGGGIANYVGGRTTISACTIVGNSAASSGGGIDVISDSVSVVDSIVAGNSAGLGPNIFGRGVQGGNNVLDIEPRLAPLASYGGPTPTMLPLPGSPARGHGTSVTSLTQAIDAGATSVPVADPSTIASTPGLYFIQIDGESLIVAGVDLPNRLLLLQAPVQSHHDAAAGVHLSYDQRGQARLRNGGEDIGAAASSGNVLVVGTTADTTGSEFTLRSALALANLDAALGQADTIRFADSLGTAAILLTQGVLELNAHSATAPITIDGGGRITLDGNQASGVVQVDAGTTAMLTGLTISNGKTSYAGGGVANHGTLTITACTIAGNSADFAGGGIANDGTLTLVSSTLNGNHAIAGGGGINNSGIMTITDCTLAANSAFSDGGGIYNDGTLSVRSSTISLNSTSFTGGGVFNFSGAALTLQNTIVAQNSAASSPDLAGTATGSGTLIGNLDAGNLSGPNMVGNAGHTFDALLAPLGYYGGPTKSMRPLPGSPALDAGVDDPTVGTDQRGFARRAGVAVDIGAVEYQYDLAVTLDTTIRDTLTYLCTVTNNGPDPAGDVSMTLVLPDGTEVISLKAGAYWSHAAAATNGQVIVTSNLAAGNFLDAGMSATLGATVRLIGQTSPILTGNVSLHAGTADTIQSNNTAAVQILAAFIANTLSLAQTTVAISSLTLAVGGTATVTLIARNAAGMQNTVGGLNVAFGLRLGTFGPVTDNGDGTYTATFTASNVGTGALTATINGQPVTSAMLTITVPTTPRGTIATTLPTFAWNTVVGADHYWLWVTDQTTGQIVINLPNVSNTSYTATQPLTIGHDYIWWSGSVQGQTTTWSASVSFTIAPTASGPSGTIATNLPSFNWNSVFGADHYYLWVADQTTGKLALDLPNVSGTSFTPTQPLTLGHAYTWWIGAVRGQALGWSAAVNFTIAPTTSGPSGTIATTLPTFAWTTVTGAEHYYLWVQDLTTGLLTVNLPNLSGTSYTLTQPLTLGDGYRWWIGAVHGQTTAWSGSLDFTIAPTASGPSSTIATALPTFTWTAVAGADHYYLWVADQTSGVLALNLPNLSVTSYTPTQPLALGDSYRWWIGAVRGQTTAWSAGLNFKIAPTPTGPSGTTAGMQPTFTWTAVAGANSYEIWLTDVASGQRLVTPVLTSVSWTIPTALTPGKTYRWWVRAFASEIASSWSDPMDFEAMS